MTSEVCMCAWTQRYWEILTCRRTHIHAQLRIILGCGPNANLKSTNTHGTQHREKETEQGKANDYYAWTKVLCCCILKCGLDLVTDTTWTAKRLINWAKVKQSPDGFNRQYSLWGRFPICLSLHLCPALSLPHILLLCLLLFHIANPFYSHILLSPFLHRDHHFFIIIIPDLIETPLHPTVFPILTFLCPNHLYWQTVPEEYFKWTFVLKGFGYFKVLKHAWGVFQTVGNIKCILFYWNIQNVLWNID